MAGRALGNEGPTVVLKAEEPGGGGAFDDSSPQRRDGELRRMAAFRIHEAANRVAVLANSAQNERLRRKLLAICQRLSREERALLDDTGPSGNA